MVILDGRTLAKKKQLELQNSFTSLHLEYPPKLVILQVGDDPASTKFVSLKQKMGKNLGVTVQVEKLKQDISQSDLQEKIKYFNQHPHVIGIMVQLPLPKNIHLTEVLPLINPKKDVDGLNPKSGILPATVVGILKLLTEYQIPISQSKVCIVNNSPLIGLPLSIELLKLQAQVSICHEFTPNIKDITRSSDILITATGIKDLIDDSWIKPGAVVIDVGFPGDVNQPQVEKVAGYMTPNPGGVGPMTVVSLFQNLYNLIIFK